MSVVTSSRALLPIEQLRVAAFRVPTDEPESDGTLEWTGTTLIIVELEASGETGLGYTYGDGGVAEAIVQLEPVLAEHDAFEIPALWPAMRGRLRNSGRQGASAMAVSAVDAALWDLKAKHLGVPLAVLLGLCREELPVYGSGGFTSYSDARLQEQFEGWAAQGITDFKLKVGREPARDLHRVQVARGAVGDEAGLFVDANSAYTCNQARAYAEALAHEAGVTWLEQPLPPEDLEGLRFLRGCVPAGLELADGEYAYDLDAFRRLLAADAVDVVMPDATRCGGVTGFLKAAALCEAWTRPVSSHCAPALHLHLGCAVPGLRHAEYFHDHARIEHELFDGAPSPDGGVLRPNFGRPGHGLAFKWADAEPYAI